MIKEKNQHLKILKKKKIYIVVSVITLIISIYLNNDYFIKIFKKQGLFQKKYVKEDVTLTLEQRRINDIHRFKKFLKRNSFHFDNPNLIDLSDIGKDRTDFNYIVKYDGGELEPEWAWVKNISIVYTWVDGSDPNFLDLKSKFYGGVRKVSSRDRSADELRYSLRSLEKYMPWHQGTIFIVTSQQIPKWLDTSHPRIKMVYHKDIFPPHIYPTYDSNTIELFFDKIPGISERFLYFNDDVFLNHYIHPCFFFTSSTFYPKVYRNVKRKIDVREVERIVQSNNIHEIFQASKYYTRQAIREYFDPDFEFRDLFHTVHVFYRDLFEPYRQLFAKELRNVYGNRFRHPTKVQTIYLYQAFMQYATQHDEFPLKLGGQGKAEDFRGFPLPPHRTIKKYSCKLVSPMIANQFIKFGRISNSSKRNNRYFKLYNTSPSIYVYNLNDAYSINRSLYELTEFMTTRYPDPTPFEKKEYVTLEKDMIFQIQNIDDTMDTVIKSLNPNIKENKMSINKDIITKNKLNIIRNYLNKKEALSHPKPKKGRKNKNNEMSIRERNELHFLLTYHGEELSKEWQWAKKISLVYILDDPYQLSDTTYLEKMLSFLIKFLSRQTGDGAQENDTDKENTYQELKYSLRSIEKYLPWHKGKIYIVLPRSIPKDSRLEELSWLNLQNRRIHLISPDDIIPHSHKWKKDDQPPLSISTSDHKSNKNDAFLPPPQPSNHTFSFSQKIIGQHQQRQQRHQRPIHSERHQIEMYLDKIPGITNKFIYMRPHYYFSNYTHPRFFFSSNSSLYLHHSNDDHSTSPLEFYPKYQFKAYYPLPSKEEEENTSLPPSINQNSFNYTCSLLLQYFGSNYIKTYRELKDAPVPLYRDLFQATRKLFKEELDALYLSTDSASQNQKEFKYDILPLYLITNFHIYGAAQPLYPGYLVGYGKIQDHRNKEEEEKEMQMRIYKENKIARELNYDDILMEIEEYNNSFIKNSVLIYSNSTKTTTKTTSTTITSLSTFIQQPNNYTHPYYGYDITSNTVAKYTMITREFKRRDPRYNHRLMQRILLSISNPSNLFFSLKWNRKDDLSPKNQQNYKKLMDYLYPKKSIFEKDDRKKE
ncbi:hypothetical protein PIROE2DRAFT_18972 [Piromyces sp. E2]|nr:hypothetical protein PIROE2DRAFT_18972 [Piromyces sp. E2]|eukprot:OUM56432.1 hypothetical protein PIROE2DRAFT_18972 [Piromyces sp. E2]